MRALLLAVLVCGSLACERSLEQLTHLAKAGEEEEYSRDMSENCNSRVGTFATKHMTSYKNAMNDLLAQSMEYLTMSSHFDRDTINRPGMKKFFRQLSDDRFEEAITKMKYMAKRGMGPKSVIDVKMPAERQYNKDMLPALGKALEDSKAMYNEYETMHREAMCVSGDEDCASDADLAHEMIDNASNAMDNVRKIATMANQLSAMYSANEYRMADYFFDQTLM